MKGCRCRCSSPGSLGTTGLDEVCPEPTHKHPALGERTGEGSRRHSCSRYPQARAPPWLAGHGTAAAGEQALPTHEPY